METLIQLVEVMNRLEWPGACTLMVVGPVAIAFTFMAFFMIFMELFGR